MGEAVIHVLDMLQKFFQAPADVPMCQPSGQSARHAPVLHRVKSTDAEAQSQKTGPGDPPIQIWQILLGQHKSKSHRRERHQGQHVDRLGDNQRCTAFMVSDAMKALEQIGLQRFTAQ